MHWQSANTEEREASKSSAPSSQRFRSLRARDIPVPNFEHLWPWIATRSRSRISFARIFTGSSGRSSNNVARSEKPLNLTILRIAIFFFQNRPALEKRAAGPKCTSKPQSCQGSGLYWGQKSPSKLSQKCGLRGLGQTKNNQIT